MEFLPRPTVLETVFDSRLTPPLRVSTLRWNPDAPGVAERTWHLPMHVSVKSPAPERFGIDVQATGTARYRVRLVWDDLHLCWDNLHAHEVMTGSLAQLLRALGQDLWRLLEQRTPLAA
jgi:hypothetical protein